VELVRLQKILAQAGAASRRGAEKLILDGRVSVNGRVTRELGTKADPLKDVIKLDGKLLSSAEEKVYYALNKPVGYVTTMNDPQGRPAVSDLISKIAVRAYPVGRLDYDSSGIIIITNDGELAQALAHPKKEIDKCYRTKVKGVPSAKAIKELSEGLLLDDVMTAPAKVRIILKEKNGQKERAETLLEIIIHEGRNRQVRRMCKAVGHPVLKLNRTSFGPIKLLDLTPGKRRVLTSKELDSLKSLTIWNG